MDRVDRILKRAVEGLRACGIAGIVLGGSRARGTHTEDSDIDIGIYYYGHSLDMATLQQAATALDDEHRAELISPIGGWGPWVNAGGWLTVDGMRVDLILRDMQRVAQVIADCVAGRVAAHYQPGHPHAFLNAMYLGELAVCRVLDDPDGQVAALKAAAHPYPPKMKQAILNLFLFEAGFSQELASRYADARDIYYVTAHVVRSVSALHQVLFALNEQYCINEKRAVWAVDRFAAAPSEYHARVDGLFTRLGSDPSGACDALGALVAETRALAGE